MEKRINTKVGKETKKRERKYNMLKKWINPFAAKENRNSKPLGINRIVAIARNAYFEMNSVSNYSAYNILTITVEKSQGLWNVKLQDTRVHPNVVASISVDEEGNIQGVICSGIA